MPNQLVLIQKSHNSGLPSQALRHTAKPVVSQTAGCWLETNGPRGLGTTRAEMEGQVSACGNACFLESSWFQPCTQSLKMAVAFVDSAGMNDR